MRDGKCLKIYGGGCNSPNNKPGAGGTYVCPKDIPCCVKILFYSVQAVSDIFFVRGAVYEIY